MARTTTTAVRGGLLVEPGRPPRREDVLLARGAIEDVGRRVAAADLEVDASGCVVLAGLVDAHTHSTQLLLPRLCDDVWFEEWMLVASYLAAPVTPEEVYVAAAVTAGELLASGGVALLDHGPRLGSETSAEAVEATVAAYVDVGVRASVAPLFADLYLWERLPPELQPPAELTAELPPQAPAEILLAQAAEAVSTWGGRHERIGCLLGPTGLERCSDGLLAGVAALAAELGVGIHTHLLDSPLQRLTFAETQTARLAAAGLLGPSSSAAHGVWLDDSEIALLAETGTTVVHCPVSNLRIGDGIAPLRRLRDAGVDVAVGVDGGNVDPSIDLFGVLRTAALVQRTAAPPEEWPTAEEVLGLCQHGGARALGLGPATIAAGARADLVLLDAERLSTRSEQVFDEVVYGAGRAAVRTVVVDGRVVFEDGRPTLPGWQELRRRAAAARDARVDAALAAAERTEPFRAALREARAAAQRLVEADVAATASAAWAGSLA